VILGTKLFSDESSFLDVEENMHHPVGTWKIRSGSCTVLYFGTLKPSSHRYVKGVGGCCLVLEKTMGECHTVTLPFTLKSISMQKNNYGNSNISLCKNIILKKIL
jgi:hypothetical protein